MHYLTEPTYAHAKIGCYNCGHVTDGVSLDESVEGEGLLMFCGGCIKDMNQQLNIGRARRTRSEKAEARRLAAATS